ncbi:MAG: aldose epimerase [Okeania sp. SIO2F4]|uniref:aldose epimerase family protein n=1 Tax=Okeania sp. SIO2F4 TaxID=2607790 RepID=UPI00142A29A4|nr:aldose epimerase [Okeania sp. SIO2F4]NES04988.1 aldose epimerase [Okeania sp. SIO2F4]
MAANPGQNQPYILSDETTQSMVVVVPERGGIVTDWRTQDQKIFYMDKERFADPTLSVRGGIPLLFPICGNLPDDTYTLDGESYKLKQHGFARTLPWEVTQQSTENGASITVTLRSSEQTMAGYPFNFELNYTYILRSNTLEMRYSHTNLSQKPMPFSTGIHPYFAVSDKTQLEFDLPSNEYKLKGEPNVNTFSGVFDFNSEEIDWAFVNLSKQSAVVTDKSRNLKLTINYDSNYSTLVFWTVKGKDFYCLEPWTGPRNAMNTGEHLLIAEPGKTVETVISMTAELG